MATSPLPVDPTTTVKPRYQRMADHFGLTTLEQLTCGCHVHVGIESEEEGVAVLDRIRVWLPTLLAVTANSPFWQGVDTGYASYRAQAWARFPSAGPTEVFGSAVRYHQRVDALVASGVLLDEGMVYFDARLSASYPTVEVRVADVCLEVDDAVLLAALVRALVDTAATDWRAGRPVPVLPSGLLSLAAWRASRSGLGGSLVDPGRGVPRPAAAVVHALQEHLGAALRANGDDERVSAGLASLVSRGTGADAQRRVLAATGDLAAVVRHCCNRTSPGIP